MSYDSYGNVRLSDLELARRLKDPGRRASPHAASRSGSPPRTSATSCGARHPAASISSTRGASATAAARFLLDGGTEAMVTIQGGRLVPIPFRDLIDSRTGRVRLRYADVSSEAYRTLYADMIRLKREDFERPEAACRPGDGERPAGDGVRRALRLSGRRQACAPRTGLTTAAGPRPAGARRGLVRETAPAARTSSWANPGSPHALPSRVSAVRFQRCMTRVSRSHPRTLMDAVASANNRPSLAGRPIQQAAKILRRCAVAQERDIAARSQGPCSITRRARAPTWAIDSPFRDRPGPDRPAGLRRPGRRRSCVPRRCRSPTREGRRMTWAMPP